MQFLFKISTILLIAHLLVATSGIPVVYHFCGGTLDTVSIGTSQQCACNHDETDNEEGNSSCAKDCCHDELTVSKLECTFLLESSVVQSDLVATLLVAMHPFLLATPPQQPVHTIAHTEHSPPYRSSDIPVLFRSLLI